MDEVKMFLFGRWMATCYSSNEMNTSDGYWWVEQLNHFNSVVYPNYEKNGTVDGTIKFLGDSKIIRDSIGGIKCLCYTGILNEPHAKCEKCGKEEWEHMI